MNEFNPLLKIRFDGDAIGPGKISVSHLRRFLLNLHRALQRTGRVLQGYADSVRQGQPPRSIKVELDLVSLTHGSPAVVLGFERRQENPPFPKMDADLDILKEALGGLKTVQSEEAVEALPTGYDTGVLRAWHDIGILFRQGIDKIEFTLNHPAELIQTTFTPRGFARIQTLLTRQRSNKIHDILHSEGFPDEALASVPQDTPISRIFWKSSTLEELARSQNVQPVTDVRALFGTWPGEENDGFEAAIEKLRHPKGDRS